MEVIKMNPKTKIETPEEKRKRLRKNEKARERHWRKTGVSDRTINWMKDTGQLQGVNFNGYPNSTN